MFSSSRQEKLLRGERGEDLPAPLPENSGHRGRFPRRCSPGEAVLHPRQDRQEGAGQEGQVTRPDLDETSPLYAFDASWVLEREAPLAGADEAGRGALAGPLVAAGVILDGREVAELEDSKALGLGRIQKEQTCVSLSSLGLYLYGWYPGTAGLGQS